ncbi:MAG: hypothetical protein Q9186_003893 [Xanthomendoza sp. 1 TL-2023]
MTKFLTDFLPTAIYEPKLAQREATELCQETPKPLPVARKRSLTLPLPIQKRRLFWQNMEQKTADQSQSTLFGRLPLEVRELIYQHYLIASDDDRCLHIFRRTDSRLGHYICTGGHESHSHMPLREWGYDRISCTRAWEKKDESSHQPLFSSSVLPLLKTCRRAYSELAEKLYSSVFCFQDGLSLQFFLSTVLPQRLNQISIIQLPWQKTYLGFSPRFSPVVQVRDPMAMLYNSLKNLHEIRIVDIGDQRWSKSWIYPQNNLLLSAAMRNTRARIVVGGRVVREEIPALPTPRRFGPWESL